LVVSGSMGLGVCGAGTLGDLAGVVASVAGTLGGARGVWKVELKTSASFVKACCCASRIDENGVAGAGFSSAWVSAAAASCAALTEQVVGMVDWCGKNPSVSAILSAAVLVA
jgi:hypothetical protein